jgi:hypothetical protein
MGQNVPDDEQLGSLAKAKTPGAPSTPWGKWPKIKPETVAPLRDGRPDMYNHQPTRFVSLAEAKARGWKHFWTGELCVTGHRAARYVANGSICVECQRIERGQVPVYGKGVPELEAQRRRKYTQKSTNPEGVSLPRTAAPVPTTSEKSFLAKYAELKDFALAAEECGRSESEFLAILSWNATFRDAVNRLEETLGVARTQKISEFFDWDDDKRKSFLYTYANTGDMKQAMRSVGVTNVQFQRELSENDDFRQAYSEAHEMAKSVFDHAASAVAIRGDSKLLGRVAANLFPEKFGESLKMDLNVKGTMTVEQQNAELSTLLSGLTRQGVLTARNPERINGPEVVDADYSVVEPENEEQTDRDPAPEAADAGADPNSDLVSGSV